MSAEGWRASAACRDHPTALFYPPPERASADYPVARKICAACPVKGECLEAAMAAEAQGARYGMVGGLTPNERDRIADRTRRCVICGAMFEHPRAKLTCSHRCTKLRDADYMREYQRTHRSTGRANPIADHGSITMAHTGCRCPACRGRRRNARRRQRIASAMRA